jgi:hypothetical protein
MDLEKDSAVKRAREKAKKLQMYTAIGKYGLPATCLCFCLTNLAVGLWNVYK